MNICRLCSTNTKKFLDLGRVPLPEEFRTRQKRTQKVITYPLGLSYCTSCLHVQLTQSIDPNLIYKKNYFYDYSITKTGDHHWKSLAKKLGSKLTKQQLVVDIGSNTGTLLSHFKALGTHVLGVDPASKLTSIARTKGIPTVTAYFTPKVAKTIAKKYGLAHVITCTNVFDHVADLSDITKAFRLLLAPTGTLVIEVPYFYQMLTQFRHVPYHQQIDYMMLTQLVSFFQTHGMTLVDAQEIALHGGSIRLFIKKTGAESRQLQKLLSREKQLLKHYPKALTQFAKNVLSQRNRTSMLVQNLKKHGKTVAAVGASAKGITFLNYCNLTNAEIAAITEKSPLKIGRFTPSGIPVVPDAWLIQKQPDYAILLSWNFSEEIKRNLTKYRGIWISPVP